MKSKERQLWEERYVEKLKQHHKRNIAKMAKRLMKRVDGVKNSMVSRSKKYKVECTVTIDDLRQMALDAYGNRCPYTQRQLKLDNMVFDHIIPISKGGPSTKENVQVISRFANNLKGSLIEEHFKMLMEWLENIPEELRKDISTRLAHGIR